MKSRVLTVLRHRWQWSLGLAATLMAGVGGAGWVRAQRLAPSTLVRVARARGIELEPGQVVSSFLSTELRNSRFRLTGVPDVVGTVGRVSVAFSGLSPARVRAEEVELTHTGGMVGLFKSWSDWHTRFLATERTELPIEFLNVRWTLARKWGPPVMLVPVSSTRLPNGTGFEAARLAVGAVAWQGLDFVVEPRTEGLDIGFGSNELKTARARLTYFDTPRKETLTLGVQRAPCGETLDRVGLSLKHEAFRRMLLLGSLNLYLPKDDPQIRGSLQFTVDHLPLPRLAESVMLFGSSGSLLMRSEMDPSLTSWQVPYAVFTLPPYTLRGNGHLDVTGSAVRVRLDVGGSMPCSALAELVSDPATRARIRTEAGPGTEASPELKVRVQIDLHTDRLDDTRVAWQVGAGCGLPVLTDDPVLALSLPPFDPPKRREQSRQ